MFKKVNLQRGFESKLITELSTSMGKPILFIFLTKLNFNYMIG